MANTCTGNLSWQASELSGRFSGNYPYYKPYDLSQNKGTVKYCFTKLKITEKIKDGDYWFVEVKSDWSTSGRQLAGAKQGWSTTVKSTAYTVKNAYSATPTFSRGSGGQTVSVGFSFGGFSVGTSQKILKKNVKVTRSGFSSTGASWSGSDVAATQVTELVFAQAVKEKVKPTFNVEVVRPYYSYTFQAVKQSGATAYKPALQQSSVILKKQI